MLNLDEYCTAHLKICATPFAVVKIFHHRGDVLINTSAPSHWLKSVASPVGPVLKFRDIPDC